jgi:hypothetical protein
MHEYLDAQDLWKIFGELPRPLKSKKLLTYFKTACKGLEKKPTLTL